MLSLIRREVHDHAIYVLASCAISLVTIGIMIYVGMSGIRWAALPFTALMLLVLCLGFNALGVAQTYSDRANRISPLLSTLAVTRDRILAARVLVGVLTVLGTLVPIIVTGIILLRTFVPPLEFYQRMVVEVSIVTVLMGLACYGIGLAVGWTTSKVWLILGDLLLLVLCVSLLAVKGFGPQMMLILLVLIGALLVRTWRTFIAASL